MNKNIEKEINKCLKCKNTPCKFGCPLGNDIPKFIKYMKDENYQKAYYILSKTTVLPALCGLICPKDNQCERMCIKLLNNNHVKIGSIEAYLGKLALDNNFKIYSTKKTKHHVLVIGSGPSSITCAAFLRRNGIKVTIIEKHDYLGGLLIHGIPDFRLNKDLVKAGLEAGFYISFAGPITFKSSKNAPEIIEMVPDDRILIETDSPYLPPEPLRGTLNSSKNLPIILQKLAEYKHMDVEELGEIVYRNSLEFFNIKD